MEFVKHSSNNQIARAGDIPNCDDLPITIIKDDERTYAIVSFWKPTPEELEILNSNGLVQLVVLGAGQPPVSVEVQDKH